MEPTLYHYLVLGSVMFCIGAYGAVSRRDAITVFISIELMLNAVILSLVGFSRIHLEVDGHMFALMIMAVAAAEAAVGLAIIVEVFRQRRTADTDAVSQMRL